MFRQRSAMEHDNSITILVSIGAPAFEGVAEHGDIAGGRSRRVRHPSKDQDKQPVDAMVHVRLAKAQRRQAGGRYVIVAPSGYNTPPSAAIRPPFRTPKRMSLGEFKQRKP